MTLFLDMRGFLFHRQDVTPTAILPGEWPGRMPFRWQWLVGGSTLISAAMLDDRIW